MVALLVFIGAASLYCLVAYYWNKENKAEQAEWFVRQLELARRLDLPVIIHSRDAAADTFDLVKEAAKRGVMLLHENEKGIYGDVAPRCLRLMEHHEGCTATGHPCLAARG